MPRSARGYNRNINTLYWTDAKVIHFSPVAKYLFLYLITSPISNLSGCYEITIDTITRDTTLTAGEVKKGLHELIDAGRVYYDYDTNEVIINNFSAYNWTTSKTVKRAVLKFREGIKSQAIRENMDYLISDYFGESPEDLAKELKQTAIKAAEKMQPRNTYASANPDEMTPLFKTLLGVR